MYKSNAALASENTGCLHGYRCICRAWENRWLALHCKLLTVELVWIFIPSLVCFCFSLNFLSPLLPTYFVFVFLDWSIIGVKWWDVLGWTTELVYGCGSWADSRCVQLVLDEVTPSFQGFPLRMRWWIVFTLVELVNLFKATELLSHQHDIKSVLRSSFHFYGSKFKLQTS